MKELELKTTRASRSDIARFKHEYEKIRALEIPGVLRTLAVTEEDDTIIIEEEEFSGGTLKEFLSRAKPSLEFFLETAEILSEITGALHSNEITHRDIRPHNVLINISTGEIKLTGFGARYEITHENEDIYSQTVCREILPYISPEQTGRMNRVIDYRTDLYSLGITLYEFAAGKPPYTSDDPLELIHSHIARKPVSPAAYNAALPEAVSNIVLTLLSKTAEDRYQNAYGVMADIHNCREQLKKTGRVELFELGEKDISPRFILPQKLFGREEEIAELMAAFDLVSHPERETAGKGVVMMLVSGAPGIGKSVLIKEINKPIVAKRGYFISGKYEQYGRDVPYSAIIQAFRGLVRNILSESKQKTETWQQKIGKALETLGKVVTDVIPEVELIIGRQQDVVELNPEEARNRFNIVFKNFIKVFASGDHPLVLFLDDLQWADQASLNFMRNMIIDPGMESLLLIGAYRDTEVSETHPLMGVLDEIGKEEVLIKKIVLAPLSTRHVNDFVSEVLRCSKERSQSLAELVHGKTGGNPFFVKQFMKTLYDNGLLEIDPVKGWFWDIDRIGETNITANVVELMANKIDGLNNKAREILKTAACIGDRFDLETLSAVTGKSISEALNELTEPVEEGLIGMSDDIYSFQHDRIMEAAYSLIPEEIKKELHLKIGRILLEKTPEEEWREKIFYIVGQLNYGSDLLVLAEERDELARLNLEAGEKARRSTAFDSASHFFKFGIDLLSPDAWQNRYDLALALYTEGGESAHLSGDQESADMLLNRVIEKARTTLDKTRVYEVKVNIYIIWNRHAEALELGKEALKFLGFPMPAKADRLTILKELVKFKIKMKGQTIESLAELKILKDPEKLAATRILMHCITTSYIGQPEYFPIVVLKFLNLSLLHGNSPGTAFAYSAYGMFLCGILGKIEEGYQFAMLALGVVAKYDSVELKPKVNHIVGGFINHWKDHIRKDLPYLMEAYKYGPEAGDITFGLYGVENCVYREIFLGQPLAEAKARYAVYYDEIKASQQLDVILFFECHYQLLLNLCDENGNRELIKGDAFNEEETIPYWTGVNQRNGLGSLLGNKLFLLVLFGTYEKAVESALVQETYLDGIVSSLYIPLHFFYYSLALLLSYSNAGRKKQKKYLKLVRKNQKKLKKWAGHAPMNYLHRYDLVEAELARVTGDAMRAMDFYRKAIRGARDNGFIPDEGIGAECAARFYYEHGDIDVARGYMARAWSCYSKWGALGKLKHLEETYPDLVLTGPAAAPAAETGKREQMGAATETAELSTDLSRVMETSRAISGEIVLSKLLTGLMRLTMENAGVERGCIILEREEELFVEAEDRENAEESVVLLSIPVNDHPGVCSAIVRYVKNNAERVLLNNGPGEGDFADDPYIRKNTPQSLLCFPIINRGTVTGIIYLESRMEQGIFNPEREDMLRAISSQVALSIDNARLYGNLERKNARLMELDKLKDEFLANTSHELRTPLNGIIGLAESMVGTPGTELSREAAANCMLIAASGKRLANLVNDILDFSKLKNRDMELKQGPVDIRSITDVVLDLCSALMGGKNLVLENTIDRDIPFVRGDENRLQQVFFNLVGNAVKFTEEGSITVSAEQESGMIRITVADTGIGIPGERINGIFESFEQADGSIEREYGGTGIGLSIVKRLVELHEGRIEVESAVGAGSRFMIILPVWKGKEKPEPEKIPAVETFLPVPGEAAREGMADSAASAGKNGYLLVVDDDPVNVRVVWSYLRTEGYGIETVPNGPAALEKIRDKGPGEQYDLVLLDLMMPKMSGYEVCRILRKSMSLFELPVIMLTARNGVEDLTAGFEAGVNDYLAKPFTKKELLSRVETLVTLKRTVKDHKEARYKLLQERMNPHFLFNALNTINAYIYSRPETAGIALQKLSQNYRFLMNQSLKSVIFFTDEWEFVRNYLDMEELRFGYRLSTEMIINGDFENIKIPPLCIQPLVENSLKHGLRNKKGKGYVRITARRDGNQVIVEVIDNGVGLTKEDIYSRSLGNILKRLKHYYPDAWLEARNRDEEGVRVIVGFSPGGGDGPDENS